MSKRLKILLLVALLFFLGVTTLIFSLPRVERGISLQVTGDPGRQVVGYLTIDGVMQPVEGTLPLTLEHRGRVLEFAIVPAEPESKGIIKVQILSDGDFWGSVTAEAATGKLEPHVLPIFRRSVTGFMSSMNEPEMSKVREKYRAAKASRGP